MNTALVLLLTLPVAAVAQQIAIGEYFLPTGGNWQDVITAGPDGALCFTENPGDRIGRITTTGEITEYPLPGGAENPYWITAGPDGALWFTGPDYIGRITTVGAIILYPLPGADPFGGGITAGPDGALWFTELHGDQIGRITLKARSPLTLFLPPIAGCGILPRGQLARCGLPSSLPAT
jgi:streptogramin lyase